MSDLALYIDEGAYLGQDTLLQLTSPVNIVESSEGSSKVGHVVVRLVSVPPDICPSGISSPYHQRSCFVSFGPECSCSPRLP